jgi:arginyl-tRNA synthetase
MQEVLEAVKNSLSQFDATIEPDLTRPEEKFGDYSTNAALQLAGKLNQPPRQIAEKLADQLRSSDLFSKVEVAGPGFINLTLNDQKLLGQLDGEPIKQLAGQEILVEFGDPNPFKEMHIGHLYSYIVGDSVSRLLEAAGATVRRLSYHGDVGLHVAKAIWGMKQLDGHDVGAAYAAGAAAYEQNQSAKEQIDSINQHVYSKDDATINRLYEQGRQESFAYFDKILAELGIETDQRYFESQSSQLGVEVVKQNTGRVFKQSDGAIVFEGERVGLHTRVFITSKDLPTYEAKDLGLAKLKQQDYPVAARSIIITANEQSEYFKVMLAALSEIDTDLAKKTIHLAHGFLSLSTGKMSSRTGQVLTATEMIETVEKAIAEKYPEAEQRAYLGAIKFGLLKHRLGSDIVYNVEESISLVGNSGPYLQYAHARARAVLSKSTVQPAPPAELDHPERSLVRKIGEYQEVLAKATDELRPHHIANYLYELAQNFNSFYEKCRIIGDPREANRLYLVEVYAQRLAGGLAVLGIEAPDHV